MPERRGELPRGRLRSRWVRVGGREFHYYVSDGPPPASRSPVVLLHGLMSARYLLPLGERLATRHRVYLPDMPGFGRTYRPPAALGSRELGCAYHDWAKAIGLKRAHLLGQSWGCNIAVEAAIHRPEAVISLVLQGLTMAPSLRSLPLALPLWSLNGLLEFPYKGRETQEAQKETPLRTLIGSLRHLFRDRLEDRLAEVRPPALVVRGTRDPLFPLAWAEQARRLLPAGRLANIPGGTHTLNTMAPTALADLSRGFWEELEAAPYPQMKGAFS